MEPKVILAGTEQTFIAAICALPIKHRSKKKIDYRGQPQLFEERNESETTEDPIHTGAELVDTVRAVIPQTLTANKDVTAEPALCTQRTCLQRSSLEYRDSGPRETSERDGRTTLTWWFTLRGPNWEGSNGR